MNAALVCPRCRGPVDVKSRHVAVAGSAVRVYCSDACLHATDEVILDDIEPVPRRKRWLWLAGLAVGGGGVAAYHWVERDAHVVYASAPAPWLAPPPELPAPPTQAAAPEISEQQKQDDALLVELMHDAWIHPLAGPKRRMPSNHTAAFGAERPGERPPECASGHCGVDVGNNWGEPVHAVHDGVVDWVNRGPNEEHGGVFVKIAHRNGALYSWYFHLAAVPRWVQPGVKITAGQVIGLLGDTGIFHSEPHLHFSLSVKAGSHERYIDPEPLIAIWPLWIVEEGKGHLSIGEAPGVPVRTHERPKSRPQPPVPAAAAVSASAPTDPAELDDAGVN